MQQEWPHIVGSGLASHTRPDSIKFRKLFLLAENSAWLQQLVFLKPMILEKLNAFAEDIQITDIVMRIGDIRPTSTAGRDTTSSVDHAVKPTEYAIEIARAWTAEIKEPKLRESLTGVIAKGLSYREQTSKPNRFIQS